ncbi:MAG: ATP-binding cassette domain-containing protein, partial [Clostridiales bacterium]
MLSYRSSTIGFVFQEYNLINDISVESNIRLAADRTIDDGEIQSLLDKYDLSEFKNKRVNLLSGGEKQRVSLIRALIKNPRLILCDEPTGALDSENSKKVFEYLKEASKDRLVLVVSHDRESADKYGDGLIEIIDGEIKKYSLNTSREVNTELQNINVTKRIKLSFNKRKDLIASLFRNRKLRFIAIIFVFLCSFSLLGITNSITSYNEDEATLKSMYSKGSNSLAFKKNLYNSNNSYNKLFEFNDDDISSVKSKVDTIIPVSSFLSSKAINNGKGTFQINSKDDQDSYLECYVGGSVEIDDGFLDKTKLTLSYGSLPSNDDEIVISDFFADMYR